MPVMGSPTKKQSTEAQATSSRVDNGGDMAASVSDFAGFDSTNVDAQDQRMRKHFEQRLTRIEQTLQVATLMDESLFKGCAARLSKLATEYETWHTSRLATTSDDTIDQEEEQYAMFEKRHFEIALNVERQLSSSVAPPQASKTRVKLPQIRLPSFDGQMDQWIPFRDAFISVIHNNAALADVDKLQYLKGALTKEAQMLLGAVEITNANYVVAWDLLKKRYDSKKLIVKKYLDRLFTTPSMKKEDYGMLIALIDSFDGNVKMAERMGVQTDGWSELLAHMICTRLDLCTLKQWEIHHRSQEVPQYEEVLQFLRGHADVLRVTQQDKARNVDAFSTTVKAKPNNSAVYTAQLEPTTTCAFCKKKAHSAYECEVFRKSSVSQRYDMVKDNKLCFNCLAASHQRNSCRAGVCRVCRQKHHTMLHSASSTNSVSGGQPEEEAVASTSKQTVSSFSHCAQTPSTSCNTNTVETKKLVLLPTAVVHIVTANGVHHWARALLDGGSQINLVTERLVQRLGVPKKPVNHTLGGIGKAQHTSFHMVQLSIHSNCTSFQTVWKCHVLKSVTWDQPWSTVDRRGWTIPDKLALADPHFDQPGPIDILIGREGCNELLLEGMIRLDNSTLLLQNTELGWIVSGKVSRIEPVLSSSLVCSAISLEDQLKRFWELEACQSPSIWSREEKECEAEFEKTTVRDENGRFVVALPKHPERIAKLGDTYEIAKRRFVSLNRRLDAQPNLKMAYDGFLNEYLDLGHMEEINSNNDISGNVYYLPHHCINRPDSLTTKLRVVFDASCKSDTGISLNDVLLVGPTVQDDLISLLLRYRLHAIVVVADIEKMYRQILVREEDRSLQRIIWKEPTDEQLRIYQLKTVTYGTASAPYLATRCLKQLANEGRETHPRASVVLETDFYMDDLITGVNSIDEGKALCEELRQLLSSAGFRLRKWASNSSEILASIPVELHNDSEVLNIEAGASIKALGLKWKPATDQLCFNVPSWGTQMPITKRIAASDAAKLFDPLGLLGPIVVIAKCFLQELWQHEKTWDEPLELDRQQRWLQFREQLEDLKKVTVPRRAVGFVTLIQLHGFSDASMKAYGACIYLRSESSDGTVTVHLLTAKSKVAPIPNTKGKKNITLPRLELSGALLLAHLWQRVNTSCKFDHEGFFWVDSTIVLYWIANHPARWKQFVANRVSEIQTLTPKEAWNHVTSEQNPADIISRGMMPSQLKETTLWWHGPPWLQRPKQEWPTLNQPPEVPTDELEEKPIVAVNQSLHINPLFELRSSFVALVRLVAYLRRFGYNCSPDNREHRKVGFLQTAELEEAKQLLMRIAQQESFREEIRDVKASRQVKSSSKLKTLCPILHDGILRVGGRLRHAPVSYDRKHPIILPASHPLTLMVARHYHSTLLHAGQQMMIAMIRERYWPLRMRNLARKVVHDCVQCFRQKPTTHEQLMGDLPPERVTPVLPFVKTGVDLCGPFYYRTGIRKSIPVKCFVAIFVCLATKAVHVELIDSLSTPSFLATLKRFVARRGKPITIECDNATNFRGADRVLKELQQLFEAQQLQHAVTSYCAAEGINFQFIPPRSPHFGGLWEAAVKSLKRHLRTTIGTAVLRRDDFETLLVQAEACLNSRPLTQLTADPEDLEIITPGHFLIHRPLSSVPEPSYDEIPANRLDRYQQTQEYVRRIWKRWSTEYLSGLQPRTKWTKKRDNIREGTMVLLKEDNLPPLKWCYGRIVKVYPGEDGLIRVVDVKSKEGLYRRAINRICVLPGQTGNENEENGGT